MRQENRNWLWSFCGNLGCRSESLPSSINGLLDFRTHSPHSPNRLLSGPGRTTSVRTSLTKAVVGLLLALTTSCMRMQRVNMGDPALEPFDSMYSVDRRQWGFTPIPKTGTVFFSRKTFRDDYDAVLYFGGNPLRSVVFRWDGKAYEWFGEQETFEGPQMWDTPDGRMHERLSITFYKEAGEGHLKGLDIG